MAKKSKKKAKKTRAEIKAERDEFQGRLQMIKLWSDSFLHEASPWSAAELETLIQGTQVPRLPFGFSFEEE